MINIIINLKGYRLKFGSDSRPIIGRDFGANITSQYRPVIIIQASIDHRSNIDSQHLAWRWAWAHHRPDHIFLHGFRYLYHFSILYLMVSIFSYPLHYFSTITELITIFVMKIWKRMTYVRILSYLTEHEFRCLYHFSILYSILSIFSCSQQYTSIPLPNYYLSTLIQCLHIHIIERVF